MNPRGGSDRIECDTRRIRPRFLTGPPVPGHHTGTITLPGETTKGKQPGKPVWWGYRQPQDNSGNVFIAPGAIRQSRSCRGNAVVAAKSAGRKVFGLTTVDVRLA